MSRLSNSLLGRDPLLTGAALVSLVVLSLAAVLQYALGGFVFVDDRLLGWTWLFDGFVGAIILAIGLSWLLSIIYAWANGGPLLAAGLALLPSILAAVVRLELVVSADVVLAFAAGTLAVWLGAWSSVPPGDSPAGTVWVAVVGAFVTAVAAVMVVRSTAGLGPHAETGVLIASGLFVLGLVTGGVWALAHWRALGWPDWRR